MIEYYLWAQQFMGTASPRCVQLLRHFGGAKNAFDGVNKSNRHFLKDKEKQDLKSASLEKSYEIMEEAKKQGYEIISLEDERYPFLLKNIYNPPILLFVKGEIEQLNNNICITVIGTRTPTEYSYKVAGYLCAQLAQRGVIIISGMAIGIDKSSHSATLAAGGRTVGVMACGISVDYPKGSTLFRDEIAGHGGVVITEQLPDGKAESWYFNQRNRIMSGLSNGTLIVEAGAKSGCRITANHAIDQNRDLFCVPPADIFSPSYAGVTAYLRDGAIPVFDCDDILNQYSGLAGIKPIRDLTPRSSFGTVEPAAPKPSDKATDNPQNLTEAQAKVYELLKDETHNIDYLIANTKLEINVLNEALLELEIDGVITAIEGGAYKIC